MGLLSRETWAQRLDTFRASPSAFMAGPESEDLGRDLLRDLRSEKLSEQMKVSLLVLSLEYPAQLWPDAPAAEEAATSLLDTLALLPPRPSALRRPLLLAATTALVAGGALGPTSGASLRLLPLLLSLALGRDLGRGLGPSSEQRPLQSTACECLRELESCRPGLLSGSLGLLRGLLGQEGPVGPVQPLSLLLALVLRNTLVIQARARASLQGLLTVRASPMEGGPWNWMLADSDARLQPQAPSWPAAEQGECGLSTLEPSPEEARDLRAAVAQLLDTSYLLTPVAQAQLLWLLGWALRGLRGQPPVLFKPQLVRLLGTAQLTLLHAVLALKAAFGEALFTAQDEALLLRRLTMAAQHPALPVPTHLFYLHCLLSFPENCPLGPAGEEMAPLLLEPQLCRGLLPSLLHDPMALLARLHLLCLFCAEDGEKEEKGQGQSSQHYLEELLAGLRQRAALTRGPRALATLCFRASYLVAHCLAGQPTVLTTLTQGLAQLYRAQPALAPHFVDLLDQAGPELGEPLRVVLQQEVVSRPGGDEALRWHLLMLAKVADGDAQSATLSFLQAAAAHCTDWGLQQALLQVCRALLRVGVVGGLADLLQTLARQLEDPDGRDHARLYYILLGHLSGPKLGVALGPSLAAPALASSLVAENHGFATALTVQEAPAPIRLSVGSQRAEGLALQLQVEVLEPVYSLELRFRVEGQLYAPLGAIHVPCLCPGRPARPLLLPLQPRRPSPTQLDIRALYTKATGLTCYAHLPPLPVKFADLFLPFPQPPDGARLGFFEKLWDSCLPKGTESRLWCPLGPQGLEGLVSHHLEPFVMVAQPPTSYYIAIRLPPDSRLLLRLEAAQADGVPVTLRTDDWAVVPLVGDYLRSLSTAV
ncbi:AP-5 complex subunit beta-1 [Saccopteryx leptura]|uniref:AP-5 complex subunit beta-1 n=1 Tax=Saccopteryx leptura TaxID=249018 RepID=UPI00339D0676